MGAIGGLLLPASISRSAEASEYHYCSHLVITSVPSEFRHAVVKGREIVEINADSLDETMAREESQP